MSDSYACVVCGRVLLRLRQGGRVWYEHAAVDLPVDHPAIPFNVEDAPAQVQYRCDFCLDEPITHTLVVDTNITLGDQTMDPEWAMCATCHDLVTSDEWLILEQRAFGKFEARFGKMGEETKTMMRIAYAQLRAHATLIYEEP